MSGKRYPEEFKIEAVKQATDRGHSTAEVANRLGISQHSLYQWLKQFSIPIGELQELQSLAHARLTLFSRQPCSVSI